MSRGGCGSVDRRAIDRDRPGNCPRSGMARTMTDTHHEGSGRPAAPPVRYPPAVESIRSTNVHALLRGIALVVLLTRSVCDPLFGLTSTDFGGAAIGIGAVENALVIAVAVLLVATRPRAVPPMVYGMWAPFLLVVFGAILYAPQFSTAARQSLVILSYWAVFTIAFFMIRSADDLPRLVLLVFASSLVPSVCALWDLRLVTADGEFRLQSTFTHPNIYAFYLVLLLGLVLYVRSSSAARWPAGARRLITLYAPILLLFLLFTQTRSAWAACALMLLAYAILVDRRLLALVLIVPIVLSTRTMVGDRIADLSSGGEIESYKQLNDATRLNSLAWRGVLWSSAMEPIAERPILGHGLESFRPSTLRFFPLATPPEGWDAHNWYVQMLFEMGLVGCLAYLWLVASLLLLLKKGLRHDRNGTVVILVIVGAYLLESYADNMIYYLAFNWYQMFIVGAFCAWILRAEAGAGLSPARRRADMRPSG